MELTNYMEKVVVNKLDQVLKMYPACCKCDDCKRDIAIMALNRLPPKYISTHRGSIFAHLEETDTQYDVIRRFRHIHAMRKRNNMQCKRLCRQSGRAFCIPYLRWFFRKFSMRFSASDILSIEVA